MASISPIPEQFPGSLPAEAVVEFNPLDDLSNSRFSRAATLIKRSLQGAVIAAEVTPINEAVRYSLFAASQVGSNNPITGAAVYGGSTLLIEGAAALSTADLLSTKQGGRLFRWVDDKVNNRLNKLNDEDKKLGWPAEAGLALLGGTAVAQLAKQHENPERTKSQNRRYGLITTAWLSGVCAVQGALMSEGIQHPSPKSIGIAVLAFGGVMKGASWAKDRFSYQQVSDETLQPPDSSSSVAELRNYNRRYNYVTEFLDSKDPTDPRVQEALDFEQDIWNQKNYGDLKDYEKYFNQSRIFVAVSPEGRTRGILRVFGNGEQAPPFLEMPFYSEEEKRKLETDVENNTLEELGTFAVEDKAPATKMFLDILRLSYRDWSVRGVTDVAIIMEPKRVKALNKYYGFTFRQAGPEVNYQGGDCAVHVMNMAEAENNIMQKKPDLYEWFTKDPLEHAA